MPTSPTAEFAAALERTRTQALVDCNMALAWQVHAPEYSLVTPAGKPFDRAGYLGAIEAGTLRYLRWEMGAVQARLSPAMVLVRYPATLEFPSGQVVRCWHTDSYELRGAAWLAVWSQATSIAAET